MTEWFSTDPRETVTKRASIVVIRPVGHGQWEAGTGAVDVKEHWFLTLHFGHELVTEWNELYRWTWLPRTT